MGEHKPQGTNSSGRRPSQNGAVGATCAGAPSAESSLPKDSRFLQWDCNAFEVRYRSRRVFRRGQGRGNSCGVYVAILAVIDAEIAQLQHARALIAGSAAPKKKPGRPKKSVSAPVSKKKKKRKLSAEGRGRIVAALKARWAAKKKAAAK
jgi:hypothetical protein